MIATTKYRTLRSKLLRRGHTLASWAKSQGYPPTTVYSAASGQRAGVKAVKILRELEGFTNA